MAASFAEATSGLPDEESSSAGPPSYFEYAAGASGVRYSVKSGSSFTVSCSPIAEADFGPFGYDAEAQVVYVVKAYIPKITLSGGLMPQAKEILVGQRLTAALALPSGWTASPWDTYQWSITGQGSILGVPTGDGAPFTSWTVAGKPQLPTYDGYFRTDLPSMACNFRRPDLVKIKCSVTLDGIGSFTVEEDVSVVLPEYPKEEYDRGVMGVFDHSAPGPYYDSRPLSGKWLEINGAELFNPDTGRFGIWWRCRLKTPDAYVLRYGDYGGWNYTQRVESWSAHAGDGAHTHSMPNMNGHSGLDGVYPYLGRGTPGPDSWNADETLHRFEDKPGSALNLAGFVSCSLSNSFSTYMMYRPPGSGSQFVPIHKLEWHSGGTATLLGGTVWALSGAQEGDGGMYYNSDPHPMWTESLNPEWSQD